MQNPTGAALFEPYPSESVRYICPPNGAPTFGLSVMVSQLRAFSSQTMFAAIPVIVLCWSQSALSAYVSTQSISQTTWNSFNRTLGGGLKTSEPLAAPCFSIVDGHPSNVSASACAAVEAGYTTPTFLSAQFGAYMFVRNHLAAPHMPF